MRLPAGRGIKEPVTGDMAIVRPIRRARQKSLTVPIKDGSLLLRGLQFLPTYYMADGLLNALQNQGTPGGILLDLGVTLGCMLVSLGISVWLLYRQAVVTASI